jgi:predicted GNAT family acetyltransferase
MTAPTVTDNAAERRFERETDHGTAVLSYRREGDRLLLTHTEVPQAAEGDGHGSALVQAAFDHARREGLRVVPVCPFVAAWVERNPDQADVAEQASR